MSHNPLPNTSRWLIALVIVIILHLAVAFALIIGWNPLPPQIPAPPPAVMLELAPMPEAPNNDPQPDPAPIEQVASNPTPVEPDAVEEPDPLPVPEPVKTPKPKVVINKPPKPKPIKKPIKKPVEKPIVKPKEITHDTEPKADVSTKASMASNNVSDKVAAPTTSASTKPSKAQITWQSMLFSRLASYKRYPSEARYKHQEGIVTVKFTLDAQGRVLNKQVIKSSGYPLLDQEVLDLLARAEPLPKPPADVLKGSNSKAITIPIEFNLKKDR